MDSEMFIRAYEAAAPSKRMSFIILRAKHDGAMVEGFPSSGALQLNFWEFLSKIKGIEHEGHDVVCTHGDASVFAHC